MALNPIVIEIKPPRRFFRIPRLPAASTRSSKIIAAVTAAVISVSMVSFAAYTAIVNGKDFKRAQGLQVDTPAPVQPPSTAALPDSNVATGTGGTSGTNSPVVTLTATPASVSIGGTALLKWTSSNSPSQCVASDDWTGGKPINGGEKSPVLTKVQTYIYTVTCKNDTGTGFATVNVSATALSTGGSQVLRPSVTLYTNPSSVFVGESSTLIWSVTNNPSSCIASGDWGGSVPASGPRSTGPLTSPKFYNYILTCKNGAGSGIATTIVQAKPVILDKPVVSLSVMPATINPGSSSTISWKATDMSGPCNASGAWSGSYAGTGGSITTGVKNTAGSFTYTLTCTNSGGTSSSSAVLTVSNTTGPIYCGGLTPCYGVSEMAARASVGNCWAWNSGTSAVPWVFNITSYRPSHPGGSTTGNIEGTSASPSCNININSILSGTAPIAGYRDKNNNATFSHGPFTKNNEAGTSMISFRVGYYDAKKP